MSGWVVGDWRISIRGWRESVGGVVGVVGTGKKWGRESVGGMVGKRARG